LSIWDELECLVDGNSDGIVGWRNRRRVELTPVRVIKYKLFKFAYLAAGIERRPTLLSKAAPVTEAYLLNASVAIKMRVVPVSTIPAVAERMACSPYRMLCSKPQYLEAGRVVVVGLRFFIHEGAAANLSRVLTCRRLG
jgi:hypothetical protein